MSTTPRRRDPGPTWLAWWIGWVFVYCWPLCFGSAIGEVFWLAFALPVTALALTGRRKAAGRPPRR
jgi:hypothetical protein